MSAPAALSVVPATAALSADLPAWFSDIAELTVWAGPGRTYPLTDAAIAAMLAETTTNPPQRLAFCAIEDGAVVAHAQVALDWLNGVARLGRVAVRPDRRGRGLARPFLTEVLARAAEAGDFPRVELNVYTFNTRAIALYESLGFEFEGVRRSSVRVGSERWNTAMYSIIRAPR